MDTTVSNFEAFQAILCLASSDNGEVETFDLTNPDNLSVMVHKLTQGGRVALATDEQVAMACFFLKILPSARDQAAFLKIPGVVEGMVSAGKRDVVLKTLRMMFARGGFNENVARDAQNRQERSDCIADVLTAPGVIEALMEPTGRAPAMSGKQKDTLVSLFHVLSLESLENIIENPAVRPKLLPYAGAIVSLDACRYRGLVYGEDEPHLYTSVPCVRFMVEAGNIKAVVWSLLSISDNIAVSILRNDEILKLLLDDPKGYDLDILRRIENMNSVEAKVKSLNGKTIALFAGHSQKMCASFVDLLKELEGETWNEDIVLEDGKKGTRTHLAQVDVLSLPGVVRTLDRHRDKVSVLEMLYKLRKKTTETYVITDNRKVVVNTHYATADILSAPYAFMGLVGVSMSYPVNLFALDTFKRLKPIVGAWPKEEFARVVDAVDDTRLARLFEVLQMETVSSGRKFWSLQR